MSAFWLTYKPLSASSPRGWPAAEMTKLVQLFETDPASATPLWRLASHQTARVGDRVFLFKQGNDPRGIFGFGEVIEPPSAQVDPTDINREPRPRAKIRLERLVDPAQTFLLDLQALEGVVPETLITAQASGNSVSEEVAAEIERRLAQFLAASPPAITNEDADDPTFDPDSIRDERGRAIRAIRVRRGQSAFRVALMEAYGGRCAITGCAVEAVLEAAHITPYLGPLANHVSNGLLLRADLHTLFDCGLLAIDPLTRTVVIANALKSSSYVKIAGRKVRQPKDEAKAPSRRNLDKRYRVFDMHVSA